MLFPKNEEGKMNEFHTWWIEFRASSTGRTFYRLAGGAVLCLMIVACAAFPLVAVALPTPTQNPNRPLEPTPTFTPTPVIGAVEVTPTPEASGVLWEGPINSTSERQYKDKGATVNTCDTDWAGRIAVVVDPGGNVHGNGEVDLQEGAKCSPHPLSGNTEKILLSVSGKADDKSFNLTLSATGFSPNPSADFGGFASLTTEAVCQRVLRNLSIPLTYPDQAFLQAAFTTSMAGCAGSSDDLMTSDNHIVLDKIGDCNALPADVQNKPMAKLCG
jgi:hypothetical protein